MADRNVIVTIKRGDRETMMRLTEKEAIDFLLAPMVEALDDSDAAHIQRETQEGEQRNGSLMFWTERAFDVLDEQVA